MPPAPPLHPLRIGAPAPFRSWSHAPPLPPLTHPLISFSLSLCQTRSRSAWSMRSTKSGRRTRPSCMVRGESEREEKRAAGRGVDLFSHALTALHPHTHTARPGHHARPGVAIPDVPVAAGALRKRAEIERGRENRGKRAKRQARVHPRLFFNLGPLTLPFPPPSSPPLLLPRNAPTRTATPLARSWSWARTPRRASRTT